MRTIGCYSRRALIEADATLAGHALISFRDLGLPPVTAPCQPRLDLVLHDCAADAGLRGPTPRDAEAIRGFVSRLSPDQSLAVQCEGGRGRSVACAAALERAQGDEEAARRALRMGTHNRRLYALLCEVYRLDVPKEPLVCLVVRVKYPLDRMAAFIHCLRRQRYDNWRAVFVTDGPLRPAPEEWGVPSDDGRWNILETSTPRGLWGHPYRQMGIEYALAAGADIIGLNNDDNYLTPGYLEQMVGALQERDAPLVLCQMLHAGSAWDVVPAQPQLGCADVGNWLARADLVRRVPWEGTDFEADGRYVERLAREAGRGVKVERPLLVKN